MLSEGQLCHFAVHGWVLREVLDADECQAQRRGLDRIREQGDPPRHSDTEDILNVDNMVDYDQLFRDWIL